MQNGGGALMDFGCYAAAWALWYKGRPQSVFASAHQRRPERNPRSEDNAVMVLSYADGVGIFEASWDFPRGIQELEVFGHLGSLVTRADKEVVVRKGGEPEVKLELPALAPEMAPIPYFVHCLRNKKPLEGMVALDLNVGVMEVIEAAKRSIETGQAVALPLP